MYPSKGVKSPTPFHLFSMLPTTSLRELALSWEGGDAFRHQLCHPCICHLGRCDDADRDFCHVMMFRSSFVSKRNGLGWGVNLGWGAEKEMGLGLIFLKELNGGWAIEKLK